MHADQRPFRDRGKQGAQVGSGNVYPRQGLRLVLAHIGGFQRPGEEGHGATLVRIEPTHLGTGHANRPRARPRQQGQDDFRVGSNPMAHQEAAGDAPCKEIPPPPSARGVV